jgi:hypothetical protein
VFVRETQSQQWIPTWASHATRLLSPVNNHISTLVFNLLGVFRIVPPRGYRCPTQALTNSFGEGADDLIASPFGIEHLSRRAQFLDAPTGGPGCPRMRPAFGDYFARPSRAGQAPLPHFQLVTCRPRSSNNWPPTAMKPGYGHQTANATPILLSCNTASGHQ